MNWISTIICLILCIISFFRDKKIYSPSVFFTGLWTVLLFFASCRFYGLFETSNVAYIYITVGVLFFFIGTSLVSRFSPKSYKSSNIINEKIYYILLIICLVGLIYNFKVIFSLLSSYGTDFYQIYNIMAKTSNGESTQVSALQSLWQERLQQYIGYPLLYTLVPVSIVVFIKNHQKRYLLIAILLSAIRFFFDIRRTYLVIFFVYILMLLIMNYEQSLNKKLLNLKGKKKFIFFGIFVIVIFSAISTARAEANHKYSFLNNLYMYYVGSIPYFSKRIELLKDNLVYTYGFTSFRGLLAPIFTIFGMFGFNEPKLMTIATSNILSLHGTIINISEEVRFNSYATIFFEFFLDGGIFGIILLSFLFGCFSAYLYKRAMTYKSMRDEFRYAYFFSLFLVLSVLHFNGVVICYIWPFIIEKILFKKDNTFKKLN